MALKLLVPIVVVAVVVADQSSHVSFTLGGAPTVSHSAHHSHTPSYTPAPSYHRPPYHPRPAYKPEPKYPSEPPYEHEPMYHPNPHYPPKTSYQHTYHREPAYHGEPMYRHQSPHHPQKPSHEHEPPVPYCAKDNPRPWCLDDKDYPTYEIKESVEKHIEKVLSLYADVAELNTEASVERPHTLEEETYLCPSDTSYVMPLRAVNTDGKWRVIVNNIDAHYKKLTQTIRIEECLSSGDACPLVPMCYESKCLQKSTYHRFLVYDSYDHYFPFAIETFRLPASCACLLEPYTIDH